MTCSLVPTRELPTIRVRKLFRNLGSELIGAGLTFGGFSESLPAVGDTELTAGAYARKHNPWSDFTNVPAAENMPFDSYFPSDFTQLPTLSIVVPNLLNDMHDGTIQQADTWLQGHLDAYVSWARTHNSLLVVTWDENDYSPGNQVPTLFVGPMVKPGQYSEPINHFNVLATLEAMYSLPRAGASATASPITDVWAETGPPLFVVAPNNSLSVFTAANTSNQLLSSGVQSVSVAPGRVAFVVKQDGSLAQRTPTGFVQLAGAGLVQSISAGSDGSGNPVVDAIGTDQSLWQHDAVGWHPLAGPGLALTASAGPNGVAFAVGLDHSLWAHDAMGWHQLAGPGLALSMSAGSDSAGQPLVDVIGTDHSLWQNDNSIWHQLANPGLVQAISSGPAGTVLAEGVDNSLWGHNSGWAKLVSGGPPPGPVLGLIGTSDSTGAPAAFLIGNDQSMWEDTTSGWIDWAPAGTALGIGVAT